MTTQEPSRASSGLRVTLVTHACMVVEVGEVVLLTDPWFSGTAFNDSWRLLHEPEVSDDLLERVTDVWISHEHPDHFHVPTLRSIRDRLDPRVRMLVRADHSDKVADALARFGFGDVEQMGHRRVLRRGQVELFSYLVGQMDSVLAVRESPASAWFVNVNDAELSATDTATLRSDLGTVSLLATQFSIAGYDGRPDVARHLPIEAERVLDRVVRAHRELGAAVTLPVASYARFCTIDNAHLNGYANRPAEVVARLRSERLGVALLGPGQTIDLPDIVRSTQVGTGQDLELPDASAEWEDIFAAAAVLAPDPSPVVPLDLIVEAAGQWAADLRDWYPRSILARLPVVDVRITDLGEELVLHPLDRRRSRAPECRLEVSSQPLHHMLSHPYGLQTLGVSGRLTVTGDFSRWKRVRTIMALRNAEIPLRPRRLLRGRTLPRLLRRFPTMVQQVRHRRSLM